MSRPATATLSCLLCLFLLSSTAFGNVEQADGSTVSFIEGSCSSLPDQGDNGCVNAPEHVDRLQGGDQVGDSPLSFSFTFQAPQERYQALQTEEQEVARATAAGEAEGASRTAAQELQLQLEGMQIKLVDLGAQLRASRQHADAAQASARTFEQELVALEAAFVRLGGNPVGIASSTPYYVLHSGPYAGNSGHPGFGTAANGGGVGAEGHRTLLKAKGRTWTDLFLLLAAVQADAQVTSAIPLSTDLTHATATERPARFLALGDARGKVYIFTPRGDLVAEHDTGTRSAVTSMASYPLRRNESTLVTGHADGEVRMHGVVENVPLGSARRSKAGLAAEEAEPQEQMEGDVGRQGGGSIAKVYLWGVLAPGAGIDGKQLQAAEPMQHVLEEHGGAAPITLMHTFRSSSRAQAKRLVAIWDAAGRMRVQRDNGTVRFQAATNHTHLASAATGAMVVTLTPTHASVLLQTLRTPPRTHTCKLLNGSRLVAAVFDPARPSRAYAVNDRAQLLTLMVPHEHRASTCKVLKVRPLPMLLPEGPPPHPPPQGASTGCEPGGFPQECSSSSSRGRSVGMGPGGEGTGAEAEPGDTAVGVGAAGGEAEERDGQCVSGAVMAQSHVLLAGLRGYLVMSSPRGVTVFNVSSAQLPPQEIITEPAAALAGLFGAAVEVPLLSSPANENRSPVHLLATSPNGGVLAVGLGTADNGIVAMFESSMLVPPALAANKPLANKLTWVQPLMIGVFALLSLLFFKMRSKSMGPMEFTPGGLAARRGKDRLEAGGRAGGHRGMGRLSDRGGLGGMGMGGLGGMGSMGPMAGMGGGWLGSMPFGDLGGRDGLGDVRGPLADMGLHPLQGMGGLGQIQEDDDDMFKAYGGFPGPRSARRGLHMNVTPIQDEGEVEYVEEG